VRAIMDVGLLQTFFKILLVLMKKYC